MAEEQNRDIEQYPTVIERKHAIKRYWRLISGQSFYVAEVWPPRAVKPAVSVLRRCDSGTIRDVTKEAKHLIGVMIQHSGKIPADELGTDVTFQTDRGLAGLNPKSARGKAQWCPDHWAQVEAGMVARTHNGIAAGVFLITVFLDKVKADGIIRADLESPDAHTMEMLRDSYSPLCCWLGETVVQEILQASRVEELEKSGAMRELERQLKNRGKSG
jgi:hypothetical protein